MLTSQPVPLSEGQQFTVEGTTQLYCHIINRISVFTVQRLSNVYTTKAEINIKLPLLHQSPDKAHGLALTG